MKPSIIALCIITFIRGLYIIVASIVYLFIYLFTLDYPISIESTYNIYNIERYIKSCRGTTATRCFWWFE